MPRRVTSRTTLENLKGEAKRWLKALRENVGEARARLERALPNAPDLPTLRDVQHALAAEHGVPGWENLKNLLTGKSFREPTHDEIVARFFDVACPDHHVRGGPDHARALGTAMRLLARYPEIEHSSFYTEVVCGNLTAVERALAQRPELATLKSGEPSPRQSGAGGEGDMMHDLGPKGWQPLLYLCFARLSLPAVSDNALAIARALLDRGADPNAYFMAGGSRYTPLVGAIGEGEENRPPHPHRDALVRLLLERGAEPYDIQVVYNIGFHGEVQWFLEAIYERSMQLGRKADWDDPEWRMLDMGGYGSGAGWFLRIAMERNNIGLAEWCLAHGATPNPAAAKDKRFPQRTLYEEALLRGSTEMADLFARHGSPRTDVKLEGIQAFAAACFRLDKEEVHLQLAQHPEYLQAPEPMLAAAKRDRVDVVEFLLDLGVSPDVENKQKERPLHIAGYENALRVAELLIARGAEIDAREANYANTPLGCAVYYQHTKMIDLLSRYSRDVWELTYSGKLDRLRVVIGEEPERAKVAWNGNTPLMWLPPEDEALAIEITRLFLSNGADPTIRNNEGMTAADRAERLGMFDLAKLLSSAGQS
jgi:uncharacterized protein